MILLPSFLCRRFTFLVLGALLSARVFAGESLLVRNGLFLTVAPGQDEAFTGYMLVDGAGIITAIASGEPPAGTTADRVLDAGGKFVAPGFLSAHSTCSPARCAVWGTPRRSTAGAARTAG